MDYYADAVFYDAPVGRWIGEAKGSWADAMARAQELAADGWDIFRGQTRDWTLNPSARRPSLDSSKLRKFFELVMSSDELAFVRDDLRKAVFVAQHYIESTEYIDFTTDLDVAGAFAQFSSDKDVEVARENLDWSCLILGKRKKLEQHLAGYENLFSITEKKSRSSVAPVVLPGVLTARVPGIQRLAIQKSVFIATRFDESDIDIALDFHRIYFPPTHGLGKIRRQDLFPPPKSAAEKILDKHFPIKKVTEA